MTQTGTKIRQTNKYFEDYTSLKKYLGSIKGKKKNTRGTTGALFQNVDEFWFNQFQLTTGSAVEISKVSGETVVAVSANATVYIKQKTDQTGNDGDTGSLRYRSSTGTVVEKAFALHATNTATTQAITGATNYYRVEDLIMDDALAVDEVLLGNIDHSEIYGVIPAADWRSTHSRHHARKDGKTFIAMVKASFPSASNLSTLTVEFTKNGDTLAQVVEFNRISNIPEILDLCLEVKPGTDVIFKCKRNADTNHDNFRLEYVIIEAY